MRILYFLKSNRKFAETNDEYDDKRNRNIKHDSKSNETQMKSLDRSIDEATVMQQSFFEIPLNWIRVYWKKSHHFIFFCKQLSLLLIILDILWSLLSKSITIQVTIHGIFFLKIKLISKINNNKVRIGFFVCFLRNQSKWDTLAWCERMDWIECKHVSSSIESNICSVLQIK